MSLAISIQQSTAAFMKHPQGLDQQSELRDWLPTLEWTHFVTIAFNEATKLSSAWRLVKRFHYQLDQKLFGRRFRKLPQSARTFFIAFPEFASSLHFHALFTVPNSKHELFVDELPAVLKRAAKSTSSHVVKILSSEDKERIVYYITKHADLNSSIENFIVSTEFAPAHETVN